MATQASTGARGKVPPFTSGITFKIIFYTREILKLVEYPFFVPIRRPTDGGFSAIQQNESERSSCLD